MRISEVVSGRVALMGFGIEGRAALDSLRVAGLTGEVWLFGDTPPEDQAELVAQGVRFVHDPERIVGRCDVVIRSPGFAPHHPLRLAMDRSGVQQTTSTDLFMHEARANGVTVVGVTGSKGKSTSSALLHGALLAAGVPSLLMGNIGVAPLSQLAVLSATGAVAVVELSSYQCADLTLGPSVAVLLSLFPEHMDWHGGVEPYYAAKLRIAQTQRAEDTFYYERSCAPVVTRQAYPSRALQVGGAEGLHFSEGYFRRATQPLFADTAMRLPGLHNRRNACCVLAVAEAVGGTAEGLRQHLACFEGLPYRLQNEGVYGGIRWVNDAISTAPEAVAAALAAFEHDPTALIVGGFDRGFGTAALVAAVAEHPVRLVVTLPNSGRRAGTAIRSAGLVPRVLDAEDLRHAVELVRGQLPAGGLCVFSPGAPSYGSYRNFMERGQAFGALIRQS